MIQKVRQQLWWTREERPRRAYRRPVPLLLLLTLLAGITGACASDPDTLLQLDVRVPAGVSFSKLHFTIGDREVRIYRDPAHDAGRVDGGMGVDATPDARRAGDGGPGDGPRDTASTDGPRDTGTGGGARDAGAGATGGPGDAGIVDAGAPDAGAPDAGTIVGVDMLLPRRLAGPQPVVVRALDDADCVVAAKTVQVTLTPGARVVGDRIDLMILGSRDCAWQPLDAGGGGGSVPDAPRAMDAVDARPTTDARATVDSGPPPPTCGAATACGAGQNCVAGVCAAAPATCADLAADDATLKDGVYWLAGATVGAAATHAYCDMQLKVTLCADTQGEHTGQTRDTTHLRFLMRSVLEVAAGTCKIWAVRDVAQGLPLDELIDYNATGTPSKTCATLGFKADVSFGACAYGDDPDWTDCGFGVAIPRYKWSNNCTCGDYPDFYTKQGEVFQSGLPWNFSGTIFSRCTVR